MVQKRKVSKNNSKEHKENIKKDMKKRIKKRVKKNREDIGDVSYGSRVVQHSKGVVSRAPAYKAEKIRTGGFHSTFPSGQGVLDKEMSQMAMVENAFRKQKAAAAWNAMYRQGLDGELDNIPDETKKQIMEVQRGIEKQQDIDKKNKELETKRKKLDELTNKNVEALRGHSKLIKYKDGKKIPSRKKIIEETTKIDKETEKATKQRAALAKFQAADEKKTIAQTELKLMKEEAKKQYKDDSDMLNAIEDPELLRAEVMKRERMVQEFNEHAKELDNLSRRKKEYVKAQQQLMIYYEELTAKTGWEDAKIAGAIADTIRIHHGDPETIRVRVEEIMKQAEQKNDVLTKQYTEYKEQAEKLSKNWDYYNAQIRNVRDNLLTYFQNSRHIGPKFKESMHTKSIQDLLKRAKEIEQYIPEEQAKQLNLINDRYHHLTSLISILNQNNIEFVGPSKQWIDELSKKAQESPDYMELHQDTVINVAPDDDWEKYADECTVSEPGMRPN